VLLGVENSKRLELPLAVVEELIPGKRWASTAS